MKDQEILNQLKNEAEKLEIPDSLSPENMMRKLDELDETRQPLTKEQEGIPMTGLKNQPTNKKNWKKKVLQIGGAAVAASLVITSGWIIRKEYLEGRKTKCRDDGNVVVAVSPKGNDKVLSIGHGTSQVSGALDREEVLKAIVNARQQGYGYDEEGRGFDLATNSVAKGEVLQDDSVVEGKGISTPEQTGRQGVGKNEMEGGGDMSESGGEADFYHNNDQVEGVKEADIVLTDGKNIYSVYRDNHVEITEVDGENMRIASELDLEAAVIDYYKTWMELEENQTVRSYDTKMYISGNTGLFLINSYTCKRVILNDEEYRRHKELYGYVEEDIDYGFYYDDYVDYEYGKSYTILFAYDLSDINQPKLIDANRVEGDIRSSRMTGDYLYLMTEKDMYSLMMETDTLKKAKENAVDLLPEVNGEELDCSHIYLPEEDTWISGYMILTAFHIGEEGLALTDSEAVLSDECDLYMSEKNIFTYSIYDNGVEEHFTNDDGVKLVSEKTETQIYRFAYEEGQIEPKAKGMIDGGILNQFSMDEYQGYLRLVSNVNHYICPDYTAYEEDDEKMFGEDGYIWDDVRWSLLQKYYESKEYNALYILDENLNTCGSIENIAKNESIYSARFVGDKGYFVTFRQMDPLFEVDLSDVNNPVVTGELEMTGYSGYLHKWDENTMLGIGEDATEEGRRIGFKMALYSIGEEEELEEVTKYVLAGKSSYDTFEYKNMMIAPEKNFVGLSLSWYGILTSDGRFYENTDDFDYDTEEKWDYTYKEVYSLFRVGDRSIERVLDYNYADYYSQDDGDPDYYWCTGYRGLYIGDYLYIVTTDHGISAVSLDDFQVKNTVAFR